MAIYQHPDGLIIATDEYLELFNASRHAIIPWASITRIEWEIARYGRPEPTFTVKVWYNDAECWRLRDGKNGPNDLYCWLSHWWTGYTWRDRCQCLGDGSQRRDLANLEPLADVAAPECITPTDRQTFDLDECLADLDDLLAQIK